MRSIDVLVLGAGLAGLRAGIAALTTRPDLCVRLACLVHGPSGSSFANVNNALGLLVPETLAEQEAFVARASAVAAPGRIDPSLTRIMAEEAPARLADLLALGLTFRRALPPRSRSLARFPGCFWPEAPLARIFTGLANAFAAFRDRFLALGGTFLPSLSVVGLAKDREGRVCGAHLAPASASSEPIRTIPARTLVLALGGPAPLFARSLAGAHGSGASYGLLVQAGARLVNPGFAQFLWLRTDAHAFFPIQDLARPGAALKTPEGAVLSLPEDLCALAPSRAGHCPYAHGLADRALDRFVLSHADAEGRVTVRASAQGGWHAIAPSAQAGNGGAAIDAHGRTSVPGLYACGESAGLMHGANRIGGAMVLSTQVFGARAGKAAAIEAADCPEPRPEPPQPFSDPTPLLPRLRAALQRYAVLGGGLGSRAALVAELTALRPIPGPAPAVLDTALALAGELPEQ